MNLEPRTHLAWALSPETSADFLRIGAGARAAGMGSAFTAVADDATAIYWNPAGLSQVTRREIGFTHSQWLLGTNYDFLGYAHPTSIGSFGLGITRLADGQIEGRAADRSRTGGFTAADTAYALGYSRALAGGLRLGASAKYISSQIGSDSAQTFAFDLGAIRRLGGLPVSVGASVLNLGPGLKFINQRDPLPLGFAMGGMCRIVGALQMALDLKYEPYDRRTSVALGTEYSLFSMVALRAGYNRAMGVQSASVGAAGVGGTPLSGLGGGVGLRLGRFGADYTITPFGELGNVQRISVGFKFGSL